ncbi:odorant receptor 9a-like [Cydia amplana]|uniref:odorant receptor 9a-like n=1 Tax=Cydia amplana TaxID=1869771 RepID=UPI002FE60EB5
MRMIRFSLNSIAQWPYTFGPRTMRARIQSVYHYIMITVSTYLEISCVFYVRNNQDKEFIVLGHDYFNILMGIIIIELRRITKICNIAAVIIHIQIFFSMMFFNMVPLWKNIHAGMFSDRRPENGTFVHSGNYLSFVDQYSDTRGYFLVFFLNFYPSYNAAVTFLCMDLLIFIMVFHIAGHLNILVHDLRYFPRPNEMEQCMETGSRKYNEEVFVRLKDLIDRDQAIKEFMIDTSETFGISLCIYLAFHQVTGCVLLLECSQMTPEALGNYGFLTLMMFQQLIQTSVIFEFISTKSDTLADEVYSLPWELMDVRNRKAVLLFLKNVQPPRALKAGGVVSVGVLTMSTIIKTSCSYFLMLKTLTVEE